MPSTADSALCPKCGAAIWWSADRCPTCKYDVGPPNRRELEAPDEQAALEHRYERARDAADTRGALDRLNDFDREVRSRSRAVVNVWPSLLSEFLEDGRALYSNYLHQVTAETRKPASSKDDRQRRATEALLFGTYAEHVRYGALSLNEEGAKSYGACSVSSSDATAAACATVLEENSYPFVHRHRILPEDGIPVGYRARWEDRHKLVVAKLAHRIHKGTRGNAFAKILLYSDGDRATDEFLEVHFYGAFDHQSVEAVCAPRPETASDDRQHLERVRDGLTREGKAWIER